MRLLFVCTKNLARSRMAEAICRELAAGGRDEVRSAGTSPSAVRPLAARDVAWADLIVAMEAEHAEHVRSRWPDQAAKLRVLEVPDWYAPGTPGLRALLVPKVRALLDELTAAVPPQPRA